MSAFCKEVPEIKSLGSSSLFQFPVSAHPEGQQVMAQVLGSLPLAWVTYMVFQAPVLGLTQSWLLWELGKWTSG